MVAKYCLTSDIGNIDLDRTKINDGISIVRNLLFDESDYNESSYFELQNYTQNLAIRQCSSVYLVSVVSEDAFLTEEVLIKFYIFSLNPTKIYIIKGSTRRTLKIFGVVHTISPAQLSIE